MSAPALHLVNFSREADGIFDSSDNIIVDCLGGDVEPQDARRIVASWNAMRHLTVEQIEAVANGVAQLEVV